MQLQRVWRQQTPEEIAASNEAMRQRRVRELRALKHQVDGALAQLEKQTSPHLADWRERDLLDAAYDVFEVEGLWDQARDYGPRPEDA